MWVVFIWGDPMMIAQPGVPMLTLVTSYDPIKGLASGWAHTDPNIVLDTPKGPARLPPQMAMVAAPYWDGKNPRKGTWLAVDEFKELFEAAVG